MLLFDKFKTVLHSKNALNLLASSTVSIFGDWFYATALSALLVKTGDLTLLAFVTSLRQACVFVLQPFAGVVADYVNKRQLMVWSDLIRFSITASLGILIWKNAASNTTIFALTTISALAGCFFTAARLSLIPSLVTEEVRPALNSLNGSIATVALTVSPALGGLFLASFDLSIVFGINAMAFLVSASFLMFIPGSIGSIGKSRKFENPFRHVLKAAQTILKNARLLGTAMLFLASLSGVGATWIVVPKIALDHNYFGDAGIGYLMSCIGLGSMIGMIAGGLSKKSTHSTFALYSLVIFAGIFFVWGFVNQWLVATIVCSVLLGLFANTFEAPCWSIFQEETPAGSKLRVAKRA